MVASDLVESIAERASELADTRINVLRSLHPAPHETEAELVRMCVDDCLTRGQIVEAILLDEFDFVEVG